VNAAIDTLSLVKSRFPDLAGAVERTFRADPAFQSLCSDYHVCQVALQRMQKQEPTEACRRCVEYAELLDELGGEIRDWLGGRPDDGPPT
jgi:hypothetical protein